MYYIIGYLFCLGWVIGIALGLWSLVGIGILPVGFDGWCIGIFVFWWGLVFVGTFVRSVLTLLRCRYL